MECQEFRTIVADLFDKKVSPEMQKACDEHISHCAECREYYEGLHAAADMLRPKHSPIRQEIIAPSRSWLNVAAVFIGVLFISGIAFAAIQLLGPSTEGANTTTAKETIEAPSGAIGGGIRFDNVRLDSILTVVSAHYGKAVSFRDEEAKDMKFIMTWDPGAPLSDFIDGLNLFDGLSLTLLRDTIIVEITEDKVSI